MRVTAKASAYELTRRVDQVLAELRGMTSGEAARRYGFTSESIAIWRRKRAKGEPIKLIRSQNFRALDLVLTEPPSGGRIPLPGAVRTQRRTSNR